MSVLANLQLNPPVVAYGQPFQVNITFTNQTALALGVTSIRQAYYNSSGAAIPAVPRSGVPFAFGPGPNNTMVNGLLPAAGTPGIGPGSLLTIAANATASIEHYSMISDYVQGPLSQLYWVAVLASISDGTMAFSNQAQLTILRPTFLRPQPVAQYNSIGGATSVNHTSGVTFYTSQPYPGELGFDFNSPGSSFFPV